MSATVEFPIREAEALLKRTGPDGPSMTAAECLEVDRARALLAQAVAIERGSCGADGESVAEAAERLLGERVGTLQQIIGHRSLLIVEGGIRRPVNVSLVQSIEPEPA